MPTGFPTISGRDRIREVLSRRWWLGALAFATVAGCGLTLILSIPDVYRSSATVLVQQGMAAEASGLEARLETVREKMLSRPRLEEFIHRFDLYPDLKRRLPLDSVVEQLRRDIRMTLQRAEGPSGSGALIAFTISHRGARDPGSSAQVTGQLARFAVEEEASLRNEGAGATADTLKPQLDAMRARLSEQERRLGALKARNQPPGEADAALTSLERLAARRQLLTEERSSARARRDDVLRSLEALDPVAPPSEGERLAALRKELAELKQQYSDKYPDVVQLKQQIGALEQRGAGSPGANPNDKTTQLRRDLAEIDSEIASLSVEENRLRDDMRSRSPQPSEGPGQQHALLEASRDYETTKAVYDTLLKQYEEAALAAGITAPGQRTPLLRVLDPAVPPTDPASPNRPRLLLMVLLLGLAAAAAAMLLPEYLDATFHTQDDVRAFTRVPVLASIPRITTDADARRRTLRLGLAWAGSMGAILLLAHYVQHFAHGNEELALLLGGRS